MPTQRELMKQKRMLREGLSATAPVTAAVTARRILMTESGTETREDTPLAATMRPEDPKVSRRPFKTPFEGLLYVHSHGGARTESADAHHDPAPDGIRCGVHQKRGHLLANTAWFWFSLNLVACDGVPPSRRTST